MKRIAVLLLATGLLAEVGLAQIDLEPVVSGLTRPVFVGHSGDGSGRLFIVEQAGRILIFNGSALLPQAFLDIQALVTSGGERGLLGLAFHPQFAINRRFFVNYTRTQGTQLQTVVAEYQASTTDPNRANPTGQVLLSFDQPFSNHNGGFLGFGTDGYLYIATGDGGSAGDPQGNGQNLGTLLGKVLRINVNPPAGLIPPDNPFVGRAGARPEIWAYGLRNPYRMSFDFATGRLFAGDVGQNSWEEIDIVMRGRNYGWNIVEGPNCFPPGTTTCNRAGLTEPISFYGRDEGASVTGGYVFRGPANPGLNGDYIFGDYISGRIWALRENGSGAFARRLLMDTNLSISSFGVDGSGRLYVVDYGGAIFRFANQPAPDLVISNAALGTLVSGNLAVYRVDVTNQGSQTARMETDVSGTLPSGLRLVSGRGDGWTCGSASSELLCQHTDSIATGSSTALFLVVRVDPDAPASVRFTATVSNPEDTTFANNSATSDTPVVRAESVPLNYPQLAIGGQVRSILVVSNKSALAWQGTVLLRGDEGQEWDTPWTLNGGDRSGGSSFPIDLPPFSSANFTLGGDGIARDGFLEIVPGPLVSGLDLATSFFFEVRTENDHLLDSTGIAASPLGIAFVIPVEKSLAVDTGFAVAPLTATDPLAVTLTLYDAEGQVVGSRPLNVQGHLSAFVTEYFDQLGDGFVGSLRLESIQSFFATALRVEGSPGDFQLTAVPPSPLPF